MKIKPTWVAATVAAAALAVGGAPPAVADADVTYLGQPGELVNGTVVQHWTVTDLKPSSDTIAYDPVGTLWEATATDEAVSGSVTPIVSNLNARATNGQTYRVLFGVPTEQGVNPSTIAQGEKTTGKIYFDVTGEQPDSVVYNDGGTDLLVWVPAPPAPATGPTPAYSGTAPSGTAPNVADAEPAVEATEAPAAEEQTPEAEPTGSSGTPLPEGSSGTPLPEGSSGTPLPEGSSVTTLVPAPPA
ncbi:MPT63 family protein [Mycobacterium sp. SMC-4]|uniref:MPT63 family protein n=1 Tax=Mycobacterium sp. SMC-4 TaxID=2857059 RepID=UPI0021F9D130|nr:MPT63 family protein [Mycobacterium sp. SMC-4]UXA17523.1 MPT63 family protein [Mycobacterium sp. SMC-4]